MSVDKSLKLGNRLQRARSVLSRSERIAVLRDEGRWEEGRSIFGLPKVRVRKAKKRSKAKAEKPEAAEAEGVTPEAEENASETKE